MPKPGRGRSAASGASDPSPTRRPWPTISAVPPQGPGNTARQAILVDSLTKKFGHREVLHAVSLGLERGSVFGVIGPNGAGKTTTLNLVAGLIPMTGGDIVIGAMPMPAETSDTARLRWVSNQPVTQAITGAKIAAMEPQPMRVWPSAAAITRLEQTFDWVLWIEEAERKLVWSRAARVPWKQIGGELGVDRTTAWRRWQLALTKIAARLNAM